MNIFSQKRGDISARKVIFYLIFGFMTTIVFLLIVFLVPSKLSEISKIPQGLEEYTIFQRFLNSPECFAYEDEVNRVHNVVDQKKFTQERFDACYNKPDKTMIAYRLTLKYENKEIKIQSLNWEGFLKKAYNMKVLVNDNGVKDATLFVETQDI